MTNLKVELLSGKIPDSLQYFFPEESRDLFHEGLINSAINGENWFSVLITDGNNAWYHLSTPSQIGNTPYYDVDTFIGYSGPITNSKDKTFLNIASLEYDKICVSKNIIAEVCRLNPLLKNTEYFKEIHPEKITEVKQIVIVDCYSESEKQLAEFNQTCRRHIRKALNLSFEWASSWEMKKKFISFYYDSLERVGAESKWFFNQDILKKVLSLDCARVAVVHGDNQWLSAAIILKHVKASYYFLAANSSRQVTGSNDKLIYKVCKDLGASSCKHLILGGGNSQSDTDSLLLFKKKFSSKIYKLNLYKKIYNQLIYKKLVDEYSSSVDSSDRSNFFLSYRLLEKYYGGKGN